MSGPAVKCNPDPMVLKLLARLGTGFDCASKAEIDAVLEQGVDPSRIIYAQPCKTKSYIRHAAAKKVQQMTFDNLDELHKIKALYPDAELYLRILTDDSSSLCQLSLKFGASLSETAHLLQTARDLDLNVVGVSFHVGSGASDPIAFRRAVEDSRFVFDQASALGFQMHTLDVGGGFTSDLFESMAAELRDALDEYFPPSVRVIGEPGRYFVAEAYTLACSVIARRRITASAVSAAGAASAVADLVPAGSVDGAAGLGEGTEKQQQQQQQRYMLYLNDGVYGNFSSIIFDHQQPAAHVLRASGQAAAAAAAATATGALADSPASAADGDTPPQGLAKAEYSLWGPTCDGIDCISASTELPALLDVGDWLFFPAMGAYTRCSATRFNGFADCHEVVYVVSEDGAAAVLQD